MRKDEIDLAYDRLAQETPDWMSRTVCWLHSEESRKYRIPIGLLLIAGGLVGFLPIVGYEFIPVGLLVLAQDIPFLRKPVGKFILWLLRKWRALKKRWKDSQQH